MTMLLNHEMAAKSIRIRGKVYWVRELHTESDVLCFEISGLRGNTYHVAQHSHGPECTCADFTMRRDGNDPRGCKHIRALVDEGLIRPTEIRPPQSRKYVEPRLTLLQWVRFQHAWYRRECGESDTRGVYEVIADSIDVLAEIVRQHRLSWVSEVYEQDETLGSTWHPTPGQTADGAVILDEVHRYQRMRTACGDLMADWLLDLKHRVDNSGMEEYVRTMRENQKQREVLSNG